MKKPIHSYQFRLIDGMWRDVKADGGVLADVLAQYSLEIDYRTEFARIKDHELDLSFWYRAYGGKIELEIYKIERV